MENLFKNNYSSATTDDPLVSQAVQGSHTAVEKLIERHQKWIYNIALRMVGEPLDAEDVTQEVLIKIIKNLPGFKRKSSFRTWAYRIVVNHVLNMKKRNPEKKWTSWDHYSRATDNTPDMDFPDQKSLPVEKSLIIEEIKIHCMMGMLLCLTRKERLVFIFGEVFEFSGPACPTWGNFLQNFFQNLVRDEFLLPEDEKYYLKLEESDKSNRFELMADLLVTKCGRRKFEEEIKRQFDKSLMPEMENKFQLLHKAFPGLKITTNFDCLIENNTAGTNVNVRYGYEPKALDRLFTHREQNSLLKIHGGLQDTPSIVLSSSQYEEIYGHSTGFDPKAPLPGFLERMLTNMSVLFIGCSLVLDRTLMIMKSLRDMRPHFAVMRQLNKKKERVELNRQLSELGISPIWVTDFVEIEEILLELVEEPIIIPEKSLLDHGVPFEGFAIHAAH
jgi:RNA polymerase sigma factor (sigma-70 family)